jgi:hypothetical protein
MSSESSLIYPLSAVEAPMTDEQPMRIDADALLQASRRVDWRFLLPDPNLGQVAYIGPARGTLISSLRLFTRSLAVIETLAVAGSDGTLYDVVVASGPSYETLQWGIELVRPGGFLYIEMYRSFRGGRRTRSADRRLRYAADYVAAIEQFGFADIEVYWHWPDFETCTEIVPLADRDALLLTFARLRSGVGGWLKSTLAYALLRIGLFARLAPCFSIVARKQD